MLYTNKDLKKLIIPLVFEQLLAILVGMVDTVMIAGVGEAAVSGVSLVDTINILVINITAALATGGAVAAGHGCLWWLWLYFWQPISLCCVLFLGR